MTLTAAVGFTLTTYFAELLIRHDFKYWVSAIQASSTLALLAVTAAYVVLTSRILQVQRIQARSSEQEHAIRELIVELSKHPSLITVGPPKRLDIDFWPNEMLINEASEVQELGTSIFQMSALLPPTLFSQASMTSAALHQASSQIWTLATLCWQQQTDDSKNCAEWSSEKVRVRWEHERSEAIYGEIGWEELIDGQAVVSARDATKALRDALLSELQDWL